MRDLTAKSACAGLLPRTVGGVSVTEARPGPITALLPRKGARDALDAALRAAHGVGWPAPGEVVHSGTVAVLWTGLDQAMLVGVAPDPALATHAGLSDQSDAWAVVDVTGPDAGAALARLVPVDLRPAALPVGRTVRTLLGHLNVSITPFERGWRVMAFRSMADSLVHDLAEAAETVAGRAALP